ncbi:MAG TPA: hypothetical protein VFW45_17065, partial [Candidatus Polarisedimenticolia bacterium]|nr:hypothetical protein [Candidatus Polarisedimenticolia bacterium]
MSAGQARIRELTFAQRVEAQRAIEKVYYSHQIDARRPFDEAVPRAVLEEKVRDYLKQSAALERLWRTPITAEALHREIDRIGRNSRLPDRLREIYAALGNDSFLIEETVGRAALTGRLTRSFFATDARFHDSTRTEALQLREKVVSGTMRPDDPDPRREIEEVVRDEAAAPDEDPTLEASPGGGPVQRIKAPAARFEELRALAPQRPGTIGELTEEREAFVFRALLEEEKGRFLAATYRVPKTSWSEWWREASADFDEGAVVSVATGDVSQSVESASGCVVGTWVNGILDNPTPDPRLATRGVWTGSEWIVWGGSQFNRPGSGGRYDPVLDTWTPISTLNAPEDRTLHTLVWSGSEVLVWGGQSFNRFTGLLTGLNTGGRYNPTTDTWTPISTLGAPVGRSDHTAVVAGGWMVVWGGRVPGSSNLNSGGRYHLASDTWLSTSLTGAPSPRNSHCSVSTGSQMLIWGGLGGGLGYLNDGGRYDPDADLWTSMSPVGFLSPRVSAAVWAGDRMLVWGGNDNSGSFDTGGAYNPALDSWSLITQTGAPSPRNGHTLVWTGTEMIVWGGRNGNVSTNTGGRYNPSLDSWTPVSPTNAPAPRIQHLAAWTGSLMLIWNGLAWNGFAPVPVLGSGGRYDPATDTWTPMGGGLWFTGHAVWTGNVMIVWNIEGGGRYDPAVDSWLPVSTVNEPTPSLARGVNSAIWTGNVMVVWGGVSNPFFTDGGRYDPISDSWSPTSTVGSPEARENQSIVWTGTEVIVWGGYNQLATYTNTGGRYNPDTDTWRLTSTSGAPLRRDRHTAVWTGSRMVVWGGENFCCDPSNGGGIYDPVTDTWTPTSLLNAPSPTLGHTAVWTGTRMAVWGGTTNAPLYSGSGALYDPVSNSWMPISLSGAPAARAYHSAVWTGQEMIIWGGNDATTYFANGGLYDPAADSWMPMPVAGAPPTSATHQAVWTGDSMIVHGGEFFGVPVNTGGRFCGCAATTFYADADGDGFGNP